MFAGTQQSGFISIFYSVGGNPLALWDKQVKNGHIRRVIDDEVKSLVLDIGGTNVATTYITCPIKPRASLGVKLPYLVMVIKNMKKYFSFEIQILDDKDMRRRFRVSNFQSTTRVRPFCTTMPIGLSSGWNQVQFNLADFTKRAYGSIYMETIRVQLHANVRIRRIYFTDQLHSDEDLPNEFKLFAPGPKDGKGKQKELKTKDAPGQAEVPPIKAELKPDEEVPPPPTPAEESPVAKPEDTGAPAGNEVDLPAEGAAAAAESEAKGEAQPTEGGEAGGEPQVTEGESHPAEGEAHPTEGEAQPTEGEVKPGDDHPADGEPQPVDGEAGEEGNKEAPQDETAPTEGEAAPAEGEEAKPEGEGEPHPEGESPPPAESEASPVAKEGAVNASDEAPATEAPGETTAEEETTAEHTEAAEETTAPATEVSESEASPSEPATTDNEGEA